MTLVLDMMNKISTIKLFLMNLILIALTPMSANASSIEDVLRERYALYDFKRKYKKIHRVSEPEIKEEDLRKLSQEDKLKYIDSVHRYIASFEDTHLRVEEAQPRPILFNGLSLVLISNKIYIAGVNKKIIKDILYKRLSIGDEVLSIDGVSAQSLVADLGKYIPSSSAVYRSQLATYALSARAFAYPAKNNQKWKILKSDGRSFELRIPFYVNKDELQKHALAKDVLVKAGIFITSLSWTQLKRQSENDFESPVKSYFPLSEREVWRGNRDWPFLVLGALELKKKQAISYVQLNEFGNALVRRKGKRNQVLDVIEAFLNELKTNRIVIDLRDNGGGSGEFSEQLYELLAERNKPCVYWSTKYRRTSFYSALYADSKMKFSLQERKTIDKMFQSKGDYSEFSLKKVCGKRKNSLKIVLLIGPSCISTCDIFSRLMKEYGATLIGQPTNGTGSGFNSGGQFKYWDSPTNLFSVRIPVYLIGPVDKISHQPPSGRTLQVKDLVENRAVLPDVLVRESKKEQLENNMIDWINAIESAVLEI